MVLRKWSLATINLYYVLVFSRVYSLGDGWSGLSQGRGCLLYTSDAADE